jgi:hypothetical protein
MASAPPWKTALSRKSGLHAAGTSHGTSQLRRVFPRLRLLS